MKRLLTLFLTITALFFGGQTHAQDIIEISTLAKQPNGSAKRALGDMSYPTLYSIKTKYVLPSVLTRMIRVDPKDPLNAYDTPNAASLIQPAFSQIPIKAIPRTEDDKTSFSLPSGVKMIGADDYTRMVLVWGTDEGTRSIQEAIEKLDQPNIQVEYDYTIVEMVNETVSLFCSKFNSIGSGLWLGTSKFQFLGTYRIGSSYKWERAIRDPLRIALSQQAQDGKVRHLTMSNTMAFGNRPTSLFRLPTQSPDEIHDRAGIMDSTRNLKNFLYLTSMVDVSGKITLGVDRPKDEVPGTLPVMPLHLRNPRSKNTVRVFNGQTIVIRGFNPHYFGSKHKDTSILVFLTPRIVNTPIGE